jgi:hypothetical protein
MKHELIGDKFAEVLKDWLQSEKFEEVRKRNAEDPELGIYSCASHDFCDANMAMIEAFESFGEELPDDDGDQAQFDLWNKAWSYAKNTHLTA